MLRIVCLFAASAACSPAKSPDDRGPPAGFISGVGRVKGQTYTFDVEIGHATSQKRPTDAARKVPGSAAVKPSPRSMIQ
jgi:hypothetical protein